MLLSTRTSNRRSLLGYGLAIWSLLGASVWNQNAVLFATAYVAPPHPETFADFEPVHEMRQRLNITYNYQPKYIHPEHCRYMTEEECREVDESQEKGRKERLRRQRNRRRAKFEDRYGYPVGQKFKALVLLIQFPEDADKVLADPAHITRVLNGTGGWEYSPAGSVREYFRMGSLNQLDVEFEVIPWDIANFSASYIADGNSGIWGPVRLQELFEWKLNKMDAEDQFRWFDYDVNGDYLIDYMLVLHSGFPAEMGNIVCHMNYENRLWSQGFAEWAGGSGGFFSSLGFEVAGFGIASAVGTRQMCSTPTPFFDMGLSTHEVGHGFYMLDTYDTDRTDYELTIGGLGSHDLMANPYGWNRNPRIPGHMSPFSRNYAGWLDYIPITQNGYYAVQPSEISGTVYQISKGFPAGEYLLIENRQALHWDMDHPTGIAIYHVDEAANGMNERSWPGRDDGSWPREHYMVHLLSPDGNYDLEKGNQNGGNLGDATDFWLKDMVLGPTDTWPNTDAYQGGVRLKTGIQITILTDSSYIMVFKVEGIPGGGPLSVGLGLAPSYPDVTDDANGQPSQDGTQLRPPGDDPDNTNNTLAWILSLLGGAVVVSGLAAFLFL